MASVEMKGQKQICLPSWWQQLMLYLIREKKPTIALLQPLNYRMWHQTLQTYSLHDFEHFLLFQQCDISTICLKIIPWRHFVHCKKEKLFYIITKNTSVLIFSSNSKVLRFSLEQKTKSEINFCLRNRLKNIYSFVLVKYLCDASDIVLPSSAMLIF